MISTRSKLIILFLATAALSLPTSVSLAQTKGADGRIARLEEQVADLATKLNQLEKTVLGDKLIANLDGIWEQSSHTRHGQTVRETEDVIWQLKPGNSWQWILSPEPPRWTLGAMDLDATKDPIWVNFRRDRHGDGVRVIPGIIKVEDDRVYLALIETAKCAPHPHDEYAERPTSFESTKSNKVSVFVLHRQSPE